MAVTHLQRLFLWRHYDIFLLGPSHSPAKFLHLPTSKARFQGPSLFSSPPFPVSPPTLRAPLRQVLCTQGSFLASS